MTKPRRTPTIQKQSRKLAQSKNTIATLTAGMETLKANIHRLQREVNTEAAAKEKLRLMLKDGYANFEKLKTMAEQQIHQLTTELASTRDTYERLIDRFDRNHDIDTGATYMLDGKPCTKAEFYEARENDQPEVKDPTRGSA